MRDTAQQRDIEVQQYKAYLADLGRIGGRHENSRKFYLSVISALFVFLSMAGGHGVLVDVKPGVLVVVALVGIFVCIAWWDQMLSFGVIYLAKFHTLRELEKKLPLEPFNIETEALLKPKNPSDHQRKWRYRPLTVVDRVIPAVMALLFIGLLIFKFWG